MAEENLLTQIITYEQKFSLTANYNTGPERFLFFITCNLNVTPGQAVKSIRHFTGLSNYNI